MAKTKTTISVDKDLWTNFTIKVIKLYGGRKGNDVIESLLRKWVKEN